MLGEADDVLGEIERMTRKAFLPIVGPEKGKVLVSVLRDVNPRRVLEIGTLVGYSAILMGKNIDSVAEIITVEVHAGEAEAAKKNVERANLRPKVRVIIGDAKKVIPQLGGVFDFVFLDAAKFEYLKYLMLAEDKLHEGSVVVADNAGMFASQMQDYLDYVRYSGKYRSKYVAVGNDGLEISFKA